VTRSILCAKRPSVAGRFLCAAAYSTIHDIAAHFAAGSPTSTSLEGKPGRTHTLVVSGGGEMNH